MTSASLHSLPDAFTRAQAQQAGISKHRFYQLTASGEIQRLARGLYRRARTEVADADLLEIAFRAPRATLCLGTALARHGLSDAIPHALDVAIPRGTRAPVTAAPVRWHRFAPQTFGLGRQTQQLGSGLEIGIYTAERSILDAFRTRGTSGHDVAYEALRRWLRQRGHQPSTLLALSKTFPRTMRPLRQALEILL